MEKQSTIYTRARLDKAKVHHYKLEKLNGTCANWGDEDENYNLGLENVGVEVDALKMPSMQKRYFCCWLEDWYKPILKKNDPVSRVNLSEKYRGFFSVTLTMQTKCFIPYSAYTWNTRKAGKLVGLLWRSLLIMT